MKKWWFGEKKHIDQEKIEERKAARNDIRWLAEHGTDDEICAYLKALSPNASDEQIKRALAQFHRDREVVRRHGE